MQSTLRKCQGCVARFEPRHDERRKRLWCSQACRVRTHRETNEEYRLRTLEQGRLRSAARYVPTSHRLVCVVCAGSFVARWRNTKFCGDVCRFRNAHRARRAKLAGVPRVPFTFEQVAVKSDWACGLCGLPVLAELSYPHLMSGSVDHIIPLARGGADVLGNAQLAHLTCNLRKGARV